MQAMSHRGWVYYLPMKRHRFLAIVTLCWLVSIPGRADPTADRGYQVLERYPHPTALFTQGLELYKGQLYESSGLYGHSKVIRRTFPPALTPDIRGLALPDTVFAEGLTLYRDRIYLLTWRAQQGLILDAQHFGVLGSFTYTGEGWGLCFHPALGDKGQFVMSNGSDRLQWLSPDTLTVTHSVVVTDQGTPVERLNELECVGNDVVANIWYSNDIIFIDAKTGKVRARIDLSELTPEVVSDQAVLNGIAYDASDDSWLVTGKLWPVIYRLRIPLPAAAPLAGD